MALSWRGKWWGQNVRAIFLLMKCWRRGIGFFFFFSISTPHARLYFFLKPSILRQLGDIHTPIRTSYTIFSLNCNPLLLEPSYGFIGIALPEATTPPETIHTQETAGH